MAAVEFEIGKVFPARDPVARFITVLAMMSNDWTRLAKQTLSIEDFCDDAEGLRILWFRHHVSLLFEAAEFIRDTQKRFPAVETFVALPAKVRRNRDKVVGAVDPKSKRYRGKWVEGLRNVTVHYPEMHPEKAKHGKEEAFEALMKAAELTSTIDAGNLYFGEVRFHFADEVVVQWIPEKGTRRTLRDLAGDATALARFVQEQRWLTSSGLRRTGPGRSRSRSRGRRAVRPGRAALAKTRELFASGWSRHCGSASGFCVAER